MLILVQNVYECIVLINVCKALLTIEQYKKKHNSYCKN